MSTFLDDGTRAPALERRRLLQQFRPLHRHLPEKAKNQFFIDSGFSSVKIDADDGELRRMTVGQ
jgi:hypothetical protein